MPAQQAIEYKSSWHEEYLDWICGFANVQGGKIYTDKDNNGNVVGIANYKDLMEKITNKIKNLLGIICDNLKSLLFFRLYCNYKNFM